MAVPVLVDEIHVEGGISAFAVSGNGAVVAIASEGMVGIYEVEESEKKSWFRHRGSFLATTSEEISVCKLTFDPRKPVLYVKLSSGQFMKLCLEHQPDGLFTAVNCSTDELDALDLRS